MLIIDDLLCAPAKGILWIFKEIHNAAQEELANEPESISQELRNLYMQLETSAISEQQFDSQEKVLLDRLEEIEAASDRHSDEEETEDGQEDGEETREKEELEEIARL